MPELEKDDRGASLARHWLGFGALILLAGLLAAMVVNSNRAARQRAEAQHWYVHTLEVLLAAGEARAAANEALRGERGYLLTRDERFLDPYQEGRGKLRAAVDDLASLTRDNPGQRQALADLNQQTAAYLSLLARLVALEQAGRHEEAVAAVRQGVGSIGINALLAVLSRIETEERVLLRERETAAARASVSLEATDLALSSTAFVLLLLCAYAGFEASRARTRAREANRLLRLAATTDGLTGLANRRAFEAAVEAEMARSARSGAPVALAILDVDHFKRVNDTHGHHAGDQVLRALADVAHATMRNTDLLGRMGGEEFAMLMPETDLGQARIASERLCAAMASHCCTTADGKEISVTLSAGVAMLGPGETRDHWMTRADEALYAAKSAGRNRVRLAA